MISFTVFVPEMHENKAEETIHRGGRGSYLYGIV
jgi:hypothetical protein